MNRGKKKRGMSNEQKATEVALKIIRYERSGVKEERDQVPYLTRKFYKLLESPKKKYSSRKPGKKRPFSKKKPENRVKMAHSGGKNG